MQQLRICIILFGLWLPSCTDSKIEPPFNDQRTVDLLADMIIIEASLSGIQNEKRDSLKNALTSVLMDNHDADMQDLQQLSRYLEQNPEKSLEYHDKARNKIDEIQRTVN